ncbi:MAG TPA: AraC family transcriptional regulator ligand-binding domain-containing protein [Polyangiales bacterium]|nr:AraC family transcriptional regulator ligand-binding domain-containing protein [Polyangiales bacterium]
MTQGRRAVTDAGPGVASGRAEPTTSRPIASLALWPFVELARRHGLEVDELAELAGMRVTDLRDPGMRCAQPEANRLADLVCARAGEDCGIRAAETLEAGHFALFELLARTAPTVGQALAQAGRFFSLIHSEVRLAYRVEPDATHIIRTVVPDGLAIHDAYGQLAFAAFTINLRRETEHADMAPLDVWFRQVEPRDRSSFERVLGKQLRFGMPEDRMRFSPETAALPLTRKNPTVHAAAVQAATDFLRTHK